MHKIYLSFIMIIFTLSLSSLTAQSVYWEETFEVNSGDWELNGNWSITGNCLELFWSPEVMNYDMQAISPIITLPENTGDIRIIQYISQFEFGDDGEFFEIAVLQGEEIDVIWSHTENEDWGEDGGSELSYSLTEYGGEDIQLRFRSAGGSTYNINYWEIYNIAIMASLDDDLAAIGIACDVEPIVGLSVPIDITVKNVGLNTQNDYTVSLNNIDGLLVDSIQSDVALEPDEEAVFTLSWTPDSGGIYDFYGEVLLDGDDNDSNNQTELLTLEVLNQYDITLLDFIVEDYLNVGEEAEFSLHVQNSGSNTISAAELTIVLMNEDEEFLDYFSPFIGFLQPGEDVFYELYYTPETVGEITFIGGVIYQNDQNPDDNMSEPTTIAVFAPNTSLLDIGPSDSWNPMPFNFNSSHSYTQMIYLDSELMTTGFIDWLGFVYDFSEEITDSRVRIYLGETSLTEFSNEFIDVDSLTVVFDGFVDFAYGTNNCYLMLDNPYYYNGGNLVVAIHRIYNWHNNQGLRRFNGGFIGSERTISVQTDSPIDPQNPGENYPSSYQIRTKFLFNSSGVGELSGNITDSLLNPVENALITVGNGRSSVLSGPDGSYHIEMLYEGFHDVQISKPGFVEQNINDVEITENQITDLTVTLSESPAGNNPPSDVNVEVFQRNNVLISWTDAGNRSNRDLVGYYVYRDNIRLNQEPEDATEYTEHNLAVGEYQYFVTAFYDDGESVASETCYIEVTNHFIPQITQINQIENDETLQINWRIILQDNGCRDSILRNLTGFNLYRNGEQVNSEPIPAIEPYVYTDNTTENLGDYQYTITALYGDEESEHSLPWDVISIFPPQDIYGLPWGNYIEVFWTPPTEPEENGYLIGYNVYDIMQGDVLLTPEPITDEHFILEDVNPGQQYGFYVTALYNIGESVKSNVFHLTATESELYPPQDFSGDVDYSDVTLTWERPEESGNWQHWDNDEIGGSFSMPANEDFIAAIKFDEWDLMAYDHCLMHEVAFLASDEEAEYTLVIWRRDLLFPGSEMVIIHMEDLTDIEPDSWNIVSLDDVMNLENYQGVYEYAVGIMYSNYTGNPAVYDTGNNMNPKSDIIYTIDSEGNLSDHDIDANWKIRIYWYQMEQIIPSRSFTGMDPGRVELSASDDWSSLSSFDRIRRDRVMRITHGDRNLPNGKLYLTGYNLYRDDELAAFIPQFYSSYIDEELEDGSYDYYLTAVYEIIGYNDFFESDPTETISISVETVNTDEIVTLPIITELKGNYPNPFNPETAISFSLSERSDVRLEVYNILGQRVATLVNDELPQGDHRVIWNGKTDKGNSTGSGVYFYRLSTDNYTQTKKMMLLK